MSSFNKKSSASWTARYPRGMRSAYQGGKYRHTAASKIGRAFRRRRYVKKVGLNKVEKRQVKKAIKQYGETKYGRFFSYDTRTIYTSVDLEALTQPAAMPGIQNPGAPAASCYVLQTGQYLSPSATALNAVMPNCVNVMGGYQMLMGDTNRNIDGNYAYAQSQKISIRVAMKTIRNQSNLEQNYLPTHFRILYVRPKQHSEVQTSGLAGGVFLNQFGAKTGLASANLCTKFVEHDAIINPGQFTKMKEISFKLVPPQQPPGQYAATNPPLAIAQQATTPYPYERQVDIWLDRPKKKLKFSDSTAVNINDHEPMNYDFTNYIIIIATTGTPAQNGALSSDGWTLQASGTSKFRDM